MGKRKVIIPAAAGAGLLLIAFALWPTPTRSFAKYVYSPVPKSVRVVTLQSDDWLGANPEPVCYVSFTATADDIATVVHRGGFKPATTNSSVPVPPGPPGWLTAKQVGTNGRVYIRDHPPAGGGLPFGRNRHWTEFIWIDGTGTNVYFLLWGV